VALSDIILPAGKVIVLKSTSTLQLNATGVALNFGTVQSVNDLCDVASAGDSIWFNKDKAIPFMVISGRTYYLVDEQDIISSEPPIV
jgi:co-chaperonin GroES (HSP10)